MARFGFGVGVRRRLGAPGPPPPAATMTLDFIGNQTLDPRITASGGANATRINAAGTIVAAAAPRYDFDPVSLAPRGLLAEEARTNLLTGALIGGGGLIGQSVAVTAQAYTISFYGPGTLTLTGAFAGSVVGAGNYPARTSLTFTPAAGTLVVAVTGLVQYAQLEAGPFATSFIPTAGAAVTRSADALTMTGTNFSSWFNAATGTFLAKADRLSAGDAAAQYAIFGCDNDTASNNDEFIQVGSQYGAANSALLVATGGNLVMNFIPPAIITPCAYALAYAVNNGAACQNGGLVGTFPALALPVGLAICNIGSRPGFGGSAYLNGHVRSLAYWNTRLTNAQLQMLTAVPFAA